MLYMRGKETVFSVLWADWLVGHEEELGQRGPWINGLRPVCFAVSAG